MTAQNLHRLSQDEKNMIALMFNAITTGWSKTYMVEVHLDNPMENILEGGDGLVRHGGNGSRCYAKHIGDPDWCMIHIDDVPDWDIANMAEAARAQLEKDYGK